MPFDGNLDTDLAVLQHARSLIANGWCKSVRHKRDLRGGDSYCMLGALAAADGSGERYGPDTPRVQRLAFELAREIAPDRLTTYRRGQNGGWCHNANSLVAEFNNATYRTQDGVLQVFDQTIDRLVSEKETTHAV